MTTLSLRRFAALVPLAAAGLLAACAAPAAGPVPPTVPIPDSLRAPAGETLVRTLWADGVQIYECRKAPGADSPEWVFVAPDARLVDAAGTPVGRHYAGPTWEAADGSKVVGTVRAKVDAPDGHSIPWLLLATRSTGNPGLFDKVTSVQRVATVGGAAPSGGCDAAALGRQERVPYQAQYTQYTAAH